MSLVSDITTKLSIVCSGSGSVFLMILKGEKAAEIQSEI